MHQRSAQYQHKVCHYLCGDKGRGGPRQTLIKCDKGGGRSKIGVRPVTYFLNGPKELLYCSLTLSIPIQTHFSSWGTVSKLGLGLPVEIV